ncbi:hypothetical protein Tco_0289431 [Tanacetum coccineum]
MITYLKNMEGWKNKDMKSKDFDSIKELFDKAFTRVNMFVDFRTELVEGSSKRAGEELEQESTKKQKNDLETMFEPHVKDEIWKLQQRYKVLSWKLFDSCGVHCLSLQSGMIYMLVEKRYPLKPPIITDMLNKKLQGRIVRIKSLLNAGSIIVALIDVNAAQSKLVLLENFNENYSKCLRLLYKVNVAEGVNAASEEVSTAELGFSENVSDIVDERDFFDKDMSFLDIVSKKVVTNFDVFSLRVLHRVFAKVNRAFIIAHDRDVVESNVISDESLFHP